MLLAQITDLHIKRPGLLAYRKVNTTDYLKACVAKLNALNPRPDALVITGDLTDFGAPAEYQSLRDSLAALAMPYYLAVGNHDSRAELRGAFADHAYLPAAADADAEFIQYVVDFDELSLIVLDTQDPPRSGGRLCEKRRAWLAARLEQRRGKTVMVAMHHPPFKCGITHMDVQSMNADDAGQLEALLRRYPNVERVICGHVHRSVNTRFGGTIASICPSPSHQVAFDITEDGPSAFVLEPPAFHVHAHIGQRWVTHTVYVGDYGGHYPFYDAAGKLID
jgi:3',5'-cyclic AMP phosphodiesterase CpdA